MSELKLSEIKEVFPDKATKLETENKNSNYGQMFNLPEEKIKKVVQFLKDFVDDCRRQRTEWLNIRNEITRNYEGMMSEGKLWKGSSNISTMVTTIVVDLISGKLFPMVWNPELIYWKGTTAHNEEVAENKKYQIPRLPTKQ